MDVVSGYKAYNSDFSNNYDEKYEVGKSYHFPGDIKWKKSGFHFCQNLEDVFRYYSAFDDIIICAVTGFGNVYSFFDDYNEYEIMVSNNISIQRVLSRDEIIEYGKSLNGFRLLRYLTGIKLTDDEIEYIMEDKNDTLAMQYIEYYQWGNKDVFNR